MMNASRETTMIAQDRGVSIRPLEPDDWPAVVRIYEEGIATRSATFETSVPDWDAWDRSHLDTCRLVAQDVDYIVGWAALSPVSDRCVYGGVAEVSVYIATRARRRGIGKMLLDALVRESEAAGFWTLQAGVFTDNAVSIRLHERCGFRVVGIRERLGQLDGIWKDVALLERRSSVVGVE
jgi:phosphinothricin acetyltransferase